MQELAWLEQTAISIWLRESEWGFFFPLVLHSLAMGLVVGINLAVALRIVGVAPAVPLSFMCRFYPLMRGGAVVILISGLLLLLAYPAKALTNPVFYIKLICIVAALYIARRFRVRLMMNRLHDQEALPSHVRTIAVFALLLWIVSISAGRFLAYTNSILLASSFY
ncbi:MAG: hypothetical protein A3H44_02995 [Gammaproteobacteria bacterium RIFCSPLOWO2_02_FULL_57_10]|nr:MAG: hypothetical protein A3H44_02995 [Gammaproteobacteria bacterium RIFCSPLOWO2_02_FULL_57_10]